MPQVSARGAGQGRLKIAHNKILEPGTYAIA